MEPRQYFAFEKMLGTRSALLYFVLLARENPPVAPGKEPRQTLLSQAVRKSGASPEDPTMEINGAMPHDRWGAHPTMDRECPAMNGGYPAMDREYLTIGRIHPAIGGGISHDWRGYPVTNKGRYAMDRERLVIGRIRLAIDGECCAIEPVQHSAAGQKMFAGSSKTLGNGRPQPAGDIPRLAEEHRTTDGLL